MAPSCFALQVPDVVFCYSYLVAIVASQQVLLLLQKLGYSIASYLYYLISLGLLSW